MRFQKILIKDCRRLPIYNIDLSNPTYKVLHDRMVKLVKHILEISRRMIRTKSPAEKQMLHRQIVATDKQIDELVYVLYGLTKKEIKIIEESVP